MRQRDGVRCVFPNGALKQFTYGNGIVRKLTHNARGLPARSTDTYGTTKFLDDQCDYDQNENVLGIESFPVKQTLQK